MTRSSRSLLFCLLFCLALPGLSLLLGCGGSSDSAAVEFRIPVEVAPVQTGSVEDRIVTTGTLRPRESVILRVETPGFLVLGRDTHGARLTEGSTVAAGQVVAEVTGEDARLAARLDSTRLHMKTAEQELKSRRRLFAEQLIAEEEVRRAEATYEDALHEFELSQRTVDKSRITSPIRGAVLLLARDADGRPVADGQMVAPGFEVARIAPIDRLVADIELVGPELGKVRPGLPVRISHYAFAGIAVDGRVLRLSPTMDSQSHTFRAEVEIDNSRLLLLPGMFVEASIIAERRENVPVVPREAVAERAGRSVVFVVDGQRAEQRTVSLGLGDDDRVEVLEGVTAGDRIVVRGLETLTDGTRVRVVSAP